MKNSAMPAVAKLLPADVVLLPTFNSQSTYACCCWRLASEGHVAAAQSTLQPTSVVDI